MKHNLLFIITAFTFLVCNAQQKINTEQIVQSEKEQYVRNSNAFKVHSTEVTANYDIVYHSIHLYINPEIYAIRGSVFSIIEKNNSTDTFIYFDMSSALQVDSIIRKGIALAYTKIDSDYLRIQLPADMPLSLLDSFEIYYHGIPNRSGFGSFSQTYHDGVPNIWTLSEPYGAKDWWPCKQTLNDKIDSIDIHIHTPIKYTGVSNGVLTHIDSMVDENIYHWKHRYPMVTYLFAISVTNYTSIPLYINMPSGVLPFNNYVYPEHFIEGLDGVLLNMQVMHLFDSLVGIYPFMNEGYGHAEYGWGGGMEHQTMSFVGNFGFELLAHELAHQWFGDKVTCSSWQDIWLNEGFATYMSGLGYEHLLNGYYWPIFKQNLIDKITKKPDGSVYIQDHEELTVSRIFDSRLSYFKGAMLLHMLRWKMGDNAFFDGLRMYHNHVDHAYQFAGSSQFIEIMNSKSSENLDIFFKQWLYGEGYPTYKIQWYQKGDSVKINVKQHSSHQSVSFFEMPIPIRFYNAGKDTILVLDNRYSGQEFSISLPFYADSAELDPETWLLHAGSSIIALKNKLRADEWVIDKVYLNAQNEIAVDLYANDSYSWNIHVVNINGQLVHSQKLQSQLGINEIRIATNTFSSGVYIVTMEQKGEKHQYKILIP